MTFLLRFLELSDEQNISIIKELKISSELLLRKENLSSHYMNEVTISYIFIFVFINYNLLDAAEGKRKFAQL